MTPANIIRMIAVSMSLLWPAAATASSLCESLAAQLAGQANNVSSTIQARKYAKAIASQNLQLRKVKSEMRQIGCSSGSIIIIGGVKQAQCGQYENAMERMQANLDILNAKRATALQDGVSGLSRQRLARAIWENGCDVDGEDGVRRNVTFEPETNVRETIRIPGDEQPRYGQFVDLGGAANSGGLKTMCVRTCDGGYFPISSNASSLNFQRDAQVCSMMCPGTTTELYYQSVLSDDTERMVSVETGRPYGNLSTAFSFRTTGQKNKDPACGCNLSAYYEEMLRRENAIKNPAKPAKDSAIVWTKPTLRTTLQSEEAIASMSAAKVVERAYLPDPNIRRVGPQFLPDKNDMIDFGPRGE